MGRFYTNNVSAILLARLAFSEGLIDWGDEEAVGGVASDGSCVWDGDVVDGGAADD